MTTLITRLLANTGAASEAASALQSKGFEEEAVGVISGSEAEARTAMADMGVGNDAMSAYASGIAGGNALVAVRAPFGTAGKAIMALKKFDTIDVGLESEDTYLGYKSDSAYQTSVIKGGKKFLTGKGVTEPGTHYMSFGVPLLSSKQRGNAKVSTSTTFGMETIKQPSGKKNVMSGNQKMLGGKTKPPSSQKSVIDNPTPFSSALGWPTISHPD